jgi:putative nucleotidyltransferase with HDIG domain
MAESPNHHNLVSESLHNLQVAKWMTRLIVYPGVSLLIPIDMFFLHRPWQVSMLSHLGGYVVATVGIEFGFAFAYRVRRQTEYPIILATQLGSPANLRDACQTALRTVVELLDVDSALLVILQRDGKSPEIMMDYGAPPGIVKFNADGAANLEPYRRCIRTRSMFLEPIPPSHPLYPVFGPSRCRFLVPIFSMDKVVGLLTIVGPRKRSDWRDRTLLAGLARVLGLTLDNVRLYAHEYQGMLHILTSALDQRDRVTEGHSRRVADLSLIVARELSINGDTLLDIERAAILHDIGKLAVPDAILSKPGPLTPDEWVEMRRHPDVGYHLVRDVPFLAHAAEIVRAHHERFDGTGYPRGLKIDEIPIGARIFAVVDAYDAMTSDRPYRLARHPEQALREIRHQAGTQFDPVVVAAFFAAVRKGLIDSSTLRGNGDALAMMARGDGSAPSLEETHVPAS